QAEWFMAAPTLSLGGFNPSGHYVIIFDTNGVPLWWYRDDAIPLDVKLLPNYDLAWTTAPAPSGNVGTGVVERRLDGTLVRTVTAAPTPFNVSFDFHDVQLLRNGNYLIMGGYAHPADLSAFGGPASATIFDNVIQEVQPNGDLVWQWDALDNIPLGEV